MASWLDDDLGGQTLSREILTLAGPEVKLLDRSLAAFPRGLRPHTRQPITKRRPVGSNLFRS